MCSVISESSSLLRADQPQGDRKPQYDRVKVFFLAKTLLTSYLKLSQDLIHIPLTHVSAQRQACSGFGLHILTLLSAFYIVDV